MHERADAADAAPREIARAIDATRVRARVRCAQARAQPQPVARQRVRERTGGAAISQQDADRQPRPTGLHGRDVDEVELDGIRRARDGRDASLERRLEGSGRPVARRGVEPSREPGAGGAPEGNDRAREAQARERRADAERQRAGRGSKRRREPEPVGGEERRDLRGDERDGKRDARTPSGTGAMRKLPRASPTPPSRQAEMKLRLTPEAPSPIPA
jgi:hypothetical protein